jgi:hypothetical protein
VGAIVDGCAAIICLVSINKFSVPPFLFLLAPLMIFEYPLFHNLACKFLDLQPLLL